MAMLNNQMVCLLILNILMFFDENCWILLVIFATTLWADAEEKDLVIKLYDTQAQAIEA
jgi:hypothetical protein